ncbi:MAG: hypothetical protein N838_18675 [Thiohalocapsa sp. PB-PSB1]|jgi:hypothetical protein|nr:MAG: hypothetical protein N838_18675 [Thiohalocapsa sp. PB-PSB1]HCS88969.1 hypothetical protein [Chromatiaceae bacterium]
MRQSLTFLLAVLTCSTLVPTSKAGENYIGCFRDKDNPRDLSAEVVRDSKMSPTFCIDKCKSGGFDYAAVQYTDYCFCGDEYGKYGVADNCDMPCAGNDQEICGGRWANSVYATGNRVIPKYGNPWDIPKGRWDAVITCKDFANTARRHYKWQERQNCGFEGAEWSADLQYHEDRCVKQQVLPNEFRKRQQAIAKCICEPYANSAVAQNKENLSLGCGYQGSRWDSDFSNHYNWCSSGGGDIIFSGSWEAFKIARDDDLDRCKKAVKIAKVEPNKSCKNEYRITLDRSGRFWKGDVVLLLRYQGKVLDEETISAGQNTTVIGVSHLDPDTTAEGKYNWSATTTLIAYSRIGNRLIQSSEPELKLDVRQYARPYLRDLSPTSGKVGTRTTVTLTGATLLRPDKSVDLSVFPSAGGGVDPKINLNIISTETRSSSTERIVVRLDIAKDAPLGKRSIHINSCANWVWSAPFSVVADESPPPPPPPPSTGGISVNACFYLLGTYPSAVTAFAKGKIVNSKGTEGKQSFDTKKAVPAGQLRASSIFPGAKNCISMPLTGLMKGEWNIDVWTDITGGVLNDLNCTYVNVPSLSVTADFAEEPDRCHP